MVSYKATTDEVILESASLTEERKVKSEFFEDKAKSILSSVFHLANVSTYHLVFIIKFFITLDILFCYITPIIKVPVALDL